MTTPVPKIERLPIMLRPDPTRTVLRPFMPADTVLAGHQASEHRNAVIDRVLAMPRAQASRQVRRLLQRMGPRHPSATAVFDHRFADIARLRPGIARLRDSTARLIGACFSEEYAFEAAALFNPCMIAHPVQDGVPDGALRIILSLRAVGEGHVSSVIFRTGTISQEGGVTIDMPDPHPVSATAELVASGGVRFACPDHGPLSAIVLFPASPDHRRGIEDLRMTPFVAPDGSRRWLGTLTGVGVGAVRQEIFEARDFRTFDLSPITGSLAATKGMALFPRQVFGHFAMLGRQDHDGLWLNLSEDLFHWDDGTRIALPDDGWELIQLGNCGAPLEIDEGWLVLVHGVGPMRTYAIGAFLLDKANPTRLIARLASPLIAPDARQWAGYVPNTVYSCGGLIHRGTLYLPYGVADSFTTIAKVAVSKILSAMTSAG